MLNTFLSQPRAEEGVDELTSVVTAQRLDAVALVALLVLCPQYPIPDDRSDSRRVLVFHGSDEHVAAVVIGDGEEVEFAVPSFDSDRPADVQVKSLKAAECSFREASKGFPLGLSDFTGSAVHRVPGDGRGERAGDCFAVHSDHQLVLEHGKDPDWRHVT